MQASAFRLHIHVEPISGSPEVAHLVERAESCPRAKCRLQALLEVELVIKNVRVNQHYHRAAIARKPIGERERRLLLISIQI